MTIEIDGFTFSEGVVAFYGCLGPEGCGAAVADVTGHVLWHRRQVELARFMALPAAEIRPLDDDVVGDLLPGTAGATPGVVQGVASGFTGVNTAPSARGVVTLDEAPGGPDLTSAHREEGDVIPAPMGSRKPSKGGSQ